MTVFEAVNPNPGYKVKANRKVEGGNYGERQTKLWIEFILRFHSFEQISLNELN